MTAGMPHLFMAFDRDETSGQSRIAILLTGPSGQTLGENRISCTGQFCIPALTALEAGCTLARRCGRDKILAHVPDSVHRALSDMLKNTSDIPVDDDAGADYFRTGVYIYKTGLESDGFVPEPWQEQAQQSVKTAAHRPI